MPTALFSPAKVLEPTSMPLNVRLATAIRESWTFRWLGPLRGRLSRAILLSRFIPHEGQFRYSREDKQYSITFDGRNGQFHSLYDPHYVAGYEPETALLLHRLTTPTTVAYDIGSNWGYFSLLIAAFPHFRGKVCAFEPNPSVYADLQNCIRQAGLETIVTAMNCGVGDKDATLAIQADRFITGSGAINGTGNGSAVSVRRLDSLDLPAPDLIKIDAEGMELAILQGGERVLSESHPNIIFENWLHFDQPEKTLGPIAFLRSHGYEIFNPVLLASTGNRTFLASYGDPVTSLLSQNAIGGLALIPVNEANRFLFRNQLNLFASHGARAAQRGEFEPVPGLNGSS